MGNHNLTEQSVAILHELADLQHPHLKGDNHTRLLIDKVAAGEKLTTTEAFDCGKYYQRMLDQIDQDETTISGSNILHAILDFKWSVK